MVSQTDRVRASHIEECQQKIKELLRQYDCELLASGSHALLRCRKTRQMRGAK